MSLSFKELALSQDIHVVQEKDQLPALSNSELAVIRAPGRSCKYCPDVTFDDLAEFREHHRTPWHIHNQNLCLRSKKPVSEEEYQLCQCQSIDSESDDSDFWDEQEDEKLEDDEDEKASPLETFVKFSDGKNTLSIYRSLLFASKSESRSSIVSTEQLRSFIQDASNSTWAIMLFKGGKIFVGIYSVSQDKFIKKKLFKKYTERRKQGGSQLLRDKSGKVAKSAGSQIRRQNELDLLTVLQGTPYISYTDHCLEC